MAATGQAPRRNPGRFLFPEVLRNQATFATTAVPDDGCFEWKSDQKGRSKQAYHIQLKGSEPYWMAGIFWESEGEQPIRYIVFTKAPNEVMASVHDRMPVILPDEDAKLSPI